MIYLDELKRYPDKPFGYEFWAHLWADSPRELHEFASKIGMKRAWFQDHPTLWHYDVTPFMHTRAMANGAKLLVGREAREAIHARVVSQRGEGTVEGAEE